nr:hypothetical protein [uncultured Sphingomonas sp.]
MPAAKKKLCPADARAVVLIDEQIAALRIQFKAAERAVRITDCATILLIRSQLLKLRKGILA